MLVFLTQSFRKLKPMVALGVPHGRVHTSEILAGEAPLLSAEDILFATCDSSAMSPATFAQAKG